MPVGYVNQGVLLQIFHSMRQVTCERMRTTDFADDPTLNTSVFPALSEVLYDPGNHLVLLQSQCARRLRLIEVIPCRNNYRV